MNNYYINKLLFIIRYLSLFTFIVITLFYVKPTFSQTASDIHKQHLKAIGGLANIEKVKTILLSGSFYESMSMSNKIKKVIIYKKIPNLIRFEQIDNGDTTCSCFDGSTHRLGSRPERATISMLSKLRARYSKTIPTENSINDYLDVASQAILEKIIKTDTSTVFELVYLNGPIEKKFYIDNKKFLLNKQVLVDHENGLTTISNYADYKKVSGIVLASFIESETTTSEGFRMNFNYRYDDIRINIELSNEIFRCR